MSSASRQPVTPASVYRFSVYELDIRAGELRKSGTRIRLQQQPMQILAALLEVHGQIVTREELKQRLWPADTFVDFEHSLNSAVKKLRGVLNDDPDNPRFIETIPRRGYRFLLPVTTDVEELERGAPLKEDTQQRESPQSRIKFLAVTAIAVLLMATAWIMVRYRLSVRAGTRGSSISSIAVLPLQNLSQDPEQDYFVDGLTDELITQLGKQGTVRVISRTSAMHYKGSSKSLPEIARELNVDAVIEGTVLRDGSRVRITTQLVRAEPEEHLWAESYERNVSDIIGLQEEVSRTVANEIRLRIGAEQPAVAPRVRATNPEAYDAYLRGRYFLDKRVESEARKAVFYFEEAIQKDPNYAAAYSGLADCYSVSWSSLSDLAKAEASARKALALQDDLAEAHASLGITLLYRADYSGAATEIRRAIELNPNYSLAHHWYALYWLAMGEGVRALAENDTARQLNPFSVPINNARAIILIGLRRYDEALAQAERLREIEDVYTAHLMTAEVYWLRHQYSAAIAEQQRGEELRGDEQRLADQRAVTAAYSNGGYESAVREKLKRLESAPKGIYEPYELALACLEVGDKEGALRWLEHGPGGFGSLLLRTAPEMDSLRGDPRFEAVVGRVR